jgi:repressor LexA
MGRHRKDRRGKVLAFVESFLICNGYPPTFDEIREAVGLSSKSHVDYYLDALEEEGLIERTPNTPRGIRMVGMASESFQVKIEGTIAAGEPLELADEPGCGIELTTDIADPRKDLFALHVEGSSMVDELVGDGDILVVERQQEALRGQVAVVHLRDRNEATLKRIFREGEQVRLQPAHPTMIPLYEDARNVAIQGRVVAVIRRL